MGNPIISAETPKGPPNSYITLESRAASFLAPSTVPPVFVTMASVSLPDSLEVEDVEWEEWSVESFDLAAEDLWRSCCPSGAEFLVPIEEAFYLSYVV